MPETFWHKYIWKKMNRDVRHPISLSFKKSSYKQSTKSSEGGYVYIIYVGSQMIERCTIPHEYTHPGKWQQFV